VLFKHDRLYRHNIMRINYTTYDVRRKQDTINPSTAHRDVMVLAQNDDDSDHPYLYARVIGIFHANVIYTGSQMVDYHPRRVEFLWVRWFEADTHATAGGWITSTLDRLRFPPMDAPDAFGFLDPADVVRGSHIIPAFAKKRRYLDGKGMSPCAMDSGDWQSYYLSRCVTLCHCPICLVTYVFAIRFVDRDMVMRYHWGLGVGHVYSHQQSCTNAGVLWPGVAERSQCRATAEPADEESMDRDDGISNMERGGIDGNCCGSGGSQHDGSDGDGDSNGDGDGSGDEWNGQDEGGCESWEESDGGDEMEWSDEQDLLDFDEMYGHADTDSQYED
jgi:hypothetical protein